MGRDPRGAALFRMVLASRARAAARATPDPINVGPLLDRLASRLPLDSLGRLDSLLLQVLIARMSMAESEYQEQLQGALRVSLDEARQKPSGPPPAMEQDIRSLPVVLIAPEHLECTDKAACMVCQEPFKVGQPAMQLPCSHVFCPECIAEWLRRHRTCPLCRDEVLGIKPPRYSYRICGFRQLSTHRCECLSGGASAVCVLPACSHLFGEQCMRANVWRSQPAASATHRVVECPLCQRPSPVRSVIIFLDVNQPRSRYPPPVRETLLSREVPVRSTVTDNSNSDQHDRRDRTVPTPTRPFLPLPGRRGPPPVGWRAPEAPRLPVWPLDADNLDDLDTESLEDSEPQRHPLSIPRSSIVIADRSRYPRQVVPRTMLPPSPRPRAPTTPPHFHSQYFSGPSSSASRDGRIPAPLVRPNVAPGRAPLPTVLPRLDRRTNHASNNRHNEF